MFLRGLPRRCFEQRAGHNAGLGQESDQRAFCSPGPGWTPCRLPNAPLASCGTAHTCTYASMVIIIERIDHQQTKMHIYKIESYLLSVIECYSGEVERQRPEPSKHAREPLADLACPSRWLHAYKHHAYVLRHNLNLTELITLDV
jgi:hypothetical protein